MCIIASSLDTTFLPCVCPHAFGDTFRILYIISLKKELNERGKEDLSQKTPVFS
jgi:hypothetical protein